MRPSDLVDLSPVATLMGIGVALALVGVGAALWRHRHARPAARVRALTALVLFLTFDLIVFGAYTRLSDSGLGCPDWPGCYGATSPLGARDQIDAAQAALPSGPVTQRKAWVEMIHRYLATGVGALITGLLVLHLRQAWRKRQGARTSDWTPHPGLLALVFAWVCGQGLFGALTVTLKLQPVVVTLHLLGGVGLLALLALLWQAQAPAGPDPGAGLRRAVQVVLVLVVAQVALGGWVSTNYAVLVCRDFPTCQGSWWPAMEGAGFRLDRALGHTAEGDLLPFEALTAIHVTHRLGALVVTLALGALVAVLLRASRRGRAALARPAGALGALLVLQIATGVSNVVLQWPLLAALMHTGGAAALVAVLASLAKAPARRDAQQAGSVTVRPAGGTTPARA